MRNSFFAILAFSRLVQGSTILEQKDQDLQKRPFNYYPVQIASSELRKAANHPESSETLGSVQAQSQDFDRDCSETIDLGVSHVQHNEAQQAGALPVVTQQSSAQSPNGTENSSHLVPLNNKWDEVFAGKGFVQGFCSNMSASCFCFDGCVALGGQLIFDTDTTMPTDCEVSPLVCPLGAISEIWEGSTLVYWSCDYQCYNSGGYVAKFFNAETGTKQRDCLYGELGCRFEFIDENGLKLCDSRCAAQNGVMTIREDDSGIKQRHCDIGTAP